MRSLLLPIFLFIYCCSQAAPNVRISPEPAWLYKTALRSVAEPAAGTVTSGYYLELCDQQVNVGAQTSYTHLIRHIINTSGVQNASEVSVTFSPAFQQVIYHRVTIIRNGVEINQLKENAIKVVQEETDAADFQYNGLKRAFVTLKDVQAGDRIDMSWSIVGVNPVFAGKYSEEFNFYNEDPVTNFFITVIAPVARPLLLKAFNDAPAPQELVQWGNRIYHWDNPAIKITGPESSTPSWYTPYPHTSITEYQSWEGVIQWALKLFNNYQFPLPAALQTRIADWRKTANGDKEIFANLATRFVQDEVRYLGLEMGVHTHLPHSPAEVYLHRFGDCKDKALLLATILRQENIPAYVALVNTSLRSKLEETAPTGEAFNHVIVAVERSGSYQFVDATVNLQGGSFSNRYIPAYGAALVVRDSLTSLQRISPGTAYATNIVESMDVRYDDSTSFTVDSYFTGGAADNLRNTVSGTSLRELEEDNRQFYAKTYEGISVSAPMTTTDDSTANEYHVRERYSIPDVWRTDEKGKKTFDLFAKLVYDNFPDPATMPAHTPLAIAYPRKFSYTLELNMPDDWDLHFREWHTKNDYYEFGYTPEASGRHINLHFTWETFSDHIPPEALQQYRTDYKKMLAEADFSLTITRPTGEPTNSPDMVSTAPAPSHPEGKVNWEAVWLVFVLGVLFTALFKWLNATQAPVRYNAGSGEPVRGWVIVLAVSLGLCIVLPLLDVIQSDYFDASAYIDYGEKGGRRMQYLKLTELGVYLWNIGGCVALLYWLLARRDIFPRMFTGQVISFFIAELVLLALSSSVHRPGSAFVQFAMMEQIFGTIVYGAIWITYVHRSERVKNTFVVPFGEHRDSYM